MSDFFDDLTSAVRRVASNVSTEVSVAAQEQKVKEACQTLGRLYYDAVRAGAPVEGEAFDAQVAKISTLLADIKEKRRNQKVADDDFEDLT